MMITPTATRPTIAMIVNGSRASARAGAARVRARTMTRVNARSRKLGWPTRTALGYRRRNALARAMRRVQLQGGAREPHARRTLCTFDSEGGFAPLPKPPPRNRCAGKAGARKWNTPTSAGEQRIGNRRAQRWVFRFERGLRPRNRFLGEVSEGAVEAPSEETPQMDPYHRSRIPHFGEVRPSSRPVPISSDTAA